MARSRTLQKVSIPPSRVIRKSAATVIESLEQRMFLSGTNEITYFFPTPSLIVAGARIEGQFGVQVLKQGTVPNYSQVTDPNEVVNYNGNITLSLVGDNPGTLTGELSVSAQGGVAIFSDFTFSQPGTYNVAINDDNGDAPLILPIPVAAATTPYKLGFVQQPTFDPTSGTFSVEVGLEDAAGDVVPLSPDANDNIREFILSESGGPDGGFASINAELGTDGTATLTGLTVNQSGNYTFNLWGAPLGGGDTSQSVNLSAFVPPSVDPTPVDPAPVDPTPVDPAPPIVTDPIGVLGGVVVSQVVYPTSTPTPIIATKADAKSLKAEVKIIGSSGTTAVSIATADLKEAGTLTAQKGLIKTLSTEGKTAFNLLNKDASGKISLVAKDVTKVVAAEKALAKKPTDSTLQTKASAALSALQSDAAAALTVVEADSTALHTTDSANLDAIAAANPSVTKIQSNVTQGEALQAGQVSIVQTRANTLFATDVSAVLALYEP